MVNKYVWLCVYIRVKKKESLGWCYSEMTNLLQSLSGYPTVWSGKSLNLFASSQARLNLSRNCVSVRNVWARRLPVFITVWHLQVFFQLLVLKNKSRALLSSSRFEHGSSYSEKTWAWRVIIISIIKFIHKSKDSLIITPTDVCVVSHHFNLLANLCWTRSISWRPNNGVVLNVWRVLYARTSMFISHESTLVNS